MPAQPTGFEPFEILPGALNTVSAPESVGITNYVIKRDFRRIADKEARREGYVYFAPNVTRPTASQATPALNQPDAGLPITCVHMARRPNGQTAIIAATATTIYRYYSLEDPRYIEDDYFDDVHYFKSGIGEDYADWEPIGTGFSPSGKRWQVVDVNGFMVMNNAVDLPVTFQVEDACVVPIYELRDAGVASVGRITAFQGLLVCADICQIKDGDAAAFMGTRLAYNPYDPFLNVEFLGIKTTDDLRWDSIYGAYSSPTDRYQFRVLWSMAGLPRRFATSVNGTLDFGSRTLSLQYPTLAFEVGQTIVITGAGMDGGNLTARITQIEPGVKTSRDDHGDTLYRLLAPDHQVLHLDVVGLTAVGMETPTYGPNLAPALYDPGTARIPVKPGQVYLLTVPVGVTCRMVNGDLSSDAPAQRELSLYPAASITSTRQFIAASDIVSITPQGNGVTLSLVTDQVFAPVQLADAIGSIGGMFEDLEDDGSAIVGMEALRSNLIVYKETAIFVATFTGQSPSPFTFTRVYSGNEGLYFANSLVTVLGGANRSEGSGGQHYHLFAGHHGFYRFDEITLVPTPVYLEVQNLLFNHSFDNPDDVFSVNNDLTTEVFVCQPGSWQGSDGSTQFQADSTLCFDTKYNTTSTSAVDYRSAAMIRSPSDGHLWFIMGMPDGTVMQYGLLESESPYWGGKKSIYNHNGSAYSSILQSGLGAVGSKLGDCQVNAYLVRFAARSDPHHGIYVQLTAMTSGVSSQIISVNNYGPANALEIYVPCTGVGTLFSDMIMVVSPDDYCEVLSRSISARQLRTLGAGRTP